MRSICVLTSDSHNWLLRGFAHQWVKYAPDLISDVAVVGFGAPSFSLPFEFISLGHIDDYPVGRWSDAFLRLLDLYDPGDYFAVMLEDYWLMKTVDPGHVRTCFQFARDVGAFRVDLSSDRINSGGYFTDSGEIDGVDFFECSHAAYSMSLQASIFSVAGLRKVIVPGESPWQVELLGTDRLGRLPELRVYGTRQWPVRYQIMVDKGQFKFNGSWMFPPRQLSDSDLASLHALGYTSPGGVA